MKKIFLITTILAGSLFSATFNVSTTPELRTALSTAATNGEDDTIVLADGTYKTTDDGEGRFFYLTTETNSLTLQGSSADNVILSGNNQDQILWHRSYYGSKLIIKNLTFKDATNTIDDGGAIHSYGIEVYDSKFINSSAVNGGAIATQGAVESKIVNSIFIGNNAIEDGGAIFTNRLNITNSKFKNNSADINGGGIYTTNYNNIISCSFYENSSKADGGGIYIHAADSDVNIINSEFYSNVAGKDGGGLRFSTSFASSSIYLKNLIFTGNNAAERGGAIIAKHINAYNLLLISNNSGINLYDYGNNSRIYNSIFLQNGTEISGYFLTNEMIIMDYNYINLNNNTIELPLLNNIFDGIILGFVDEDNGDYNLTSSSDLIDAGTTTIEGFILPTTDLDGNARIVGASIDIGPYEFSTTRPTINSFTYTGTVKELSELTFNLDYTLADDGRTLNDIAFDYTNDGSWTAENTYTFNTAGTYTVGVKVTDSEGEFSTTNLSITIAALAFADMTDEQKLVKAIDSTYFNEIMAIISSKESTATTTGIATGESNVTSNPSSYGLLTQTQSDNLVSLAQSASYNDGLIHGEANVKANPSTFGLITIADKETAVTSALEQGKQLVLSNPSSFGLELKESLTKAKIDSLSTGWHNISNPSEVTDLTIFDNASIVWIFNNSTSSWEAYSSNETYKLEIQNDSSVELATKVNAGVGVWILK